MMMNECEYSSVFQQLLVYLFGFPWKPFTHKSFSCFLVEMRNLIKAFGWCNFTFKSCHRVSMVQPFEAFFLLLSQLNVDTDTTCHVSRSSCDVGTFSSSSFSNSSLYLWIFSAENTRTFDLTSQHTGQRTRFVG